ncbi:MAG: hypothetical protein ACRCWF_06055 [Beijerinckiaceae bacterium]
MTGPINSTLPINNVSTTPVSLFTDVLTEVGVTSTTTPPPSPTLVAGGVPSQSDFPRLSTDQQVNFVNNIISKTTWFNSIHPSARPFLKAAIQSTLQEEVNRGVLSSPNGADVERWINQAATVNAAGQYDPSGASRRQAISNRAIGMRMENLAYLVSPNADSRALGRAYTAYAANVIANADPNSNWSKMDLLSRYTSVADTLQSQPGRSIASQIAGDVARLDMVAAPAESVSSAAPDPSLPRPYTSPDGRLLITPVRDASGNIVNVTTELNRGYVAPNRPLNTLYVDLSPQLQSQGVSLGSLDSAINETLRFLNLINKETNDPSLGFAIGTGANNLLFGPDPRASLNTTISTYSNSWNNLVLARNNLAQALNSGDAAKITTAYNEVRSQLQLVVNNAEAAATRFNEVKSDATATVLAPLELSRGLVIGIAAGGVGSLTGGIGGFFAGGATAVALDAITRPVYSIVGGNVLGIDPTLISLSQPPLAVSAPINFLTGGLGGINLGTPLQTFIFQGVSGSTINWAGSAFTLGRPPSAEETAAILTLSFGGAALQGLGQAALTTRLNQTVDAVSQQPVGTVVRIGDAVLERMSNGVKLQTPVGEIALGVTPDGVVVYPSTQGAVISLAPQPSQLSTGVGGNTGTNPGSTGTPIVPTVTTSPLTAIQNAMLDQLQSAGIFGATSPRSVRVGGQSFIEATDASGRRFSISVNPDGTLNNQSVIDQGQVNFVSQNPPGGTGNSGGGLTPNQPPTSPSQNGPVGAIARLAGQNEQIVPYASGISLIYDLNGNFVKAIGRNGQELKDGAGRTLIGGPLGIKPPTTVGGDLPLMTPAAQPMLIPGEVIYSYPNDVRLVYDSQGKFIDAIGRDGLTLVDEYGKKIYPPNGSWNPPAPGESFIQSGTYSPRQYQADVDAAVEASVNALRQGGVSVEQAMDIGRRGLSGVPGALKLFERDIGPGILQNRSDFGPMFTARQGGWDRTNKLLIDRAIGDADTARAQIATDMKGGMNLQDALAKAQTSLGANSQSYKLLQQSIVDKVPLTVALGKVGYSDFLVGTIDRPSLDSIVTTEALKAQPSPTSGQQSQFKTSFQQTSDLVDRARASIQTSLQSNLDGDTMRQLAFAELGDDPQALGMLLGSLDEVPIAGVGAEGFLGDLASGFISRQQIWDSPLIADNYFKEPFSLAANPYLDAKYVPETEFRLGAGVKITPGFSVTLTNPATGQPLTNPWTGGELSLGTSYQAASIAVLPVGNRILGSLWANRFNILNSSDPLAAAGTQLAKSTGLSVRTDVLGTDPQLIRNTKVPNFLGYGDADILSFKNSDFKKALDAWANNPIARSATVDAGGGGFVFRSNQATRSSNGTVDVRGVLQVDVTKLADPLSSAGTNPRLTSGSGQLDFFGQPIDTSKPYYVLNTAMSTKPLQETYMGVDAPAALQDLMPGVPRLSGGLELRSEPNSKTKTEIPAGAILPAWFVESLNNRMKQLPMTISASGAVAPGASQLPGGQMNIVDARNAIAAVASAPGSDLKYKIGTDTPFFPLTQRSSGVPGTAMTAEDANRFDFRISEELRLQATLTGNMELRDLFPKDFPSVYDTLVPQDINTSKTRTRVGVTARVLPEGEINLGVATIRFFSAKPEAIAQVLKAGNTPAPLVASNELTTFSVDVGGMVYEGEIPKWLSIYMERASPAGVAPTGASNGAAITLPVGGVDALKTFIRDKIATLPAGSPLRQQLEVFQRDVLPKLKDGSRLTGDQLDKLDVLLVNVATGGLGKSPPAPGPNPPITTNTDSNPSIFAPYPGDVSTTGVFPSGTVLGALPKGLVRDADGKITISREFYFPTAPNGNLSSTQINQLLLEGQNGVGTSNLNPNRPISFAELRAFDRSTGYTTTAPGGPLSDAQIRTTFPELFVRTSAFASGTPTAIFADALRNGASQSDAYHLYRLAVAANSSGAPQTTATPPATSTEAPSPVTEERVRFSHNAENVTMGRAMSSLGGLLSQAGRQRGDNTLVAAGVIMSGAGDLIVGLNDGIAGSAQDAGLRFAGSLANFLGSTGNNQALDIAGSVISGVPVLRDLFTNSGSFNNLVRDSAGNITSGINDGSAAVASLVGGLLTQITNIPQFSQLGGLSSSVLQIMGNRVPGGATGLWGQAAMQVLDLVGVKIPAPARSLMNGVIAAFSGPWAIAAFVGGFLMNVFSAGTFTTERVLRSGIDADGNGKFFDTALVASTFNRSIFAEIKQGKARINYDVTDIDPELLKHVDVSVTPILTQGAEIVRRYRTVGKGIPSITYLLNGKTGQFLDVNGRKTNPFETADGNDYWNPPERAVYFKTQDGTFKIAGDVTPATGWKDVAVGRIEGAPSDQYTVSISASYDAINSSIRTDRDWIGSDSFVVSAARAQEIMAAIGGGSARLGSSKPLISTGGLFAAGTDLGNSLRNLDVKFIGANKANIFHYFVDFNGDFKPDEVSTVVDIKKNYHKNIGFTTVDFRGNDRREMFSISANSEQEALNIAGVTKQLWEWLASNLDVLQKSSDLQFLIGDQPIADVRNGAAPNITTERLYQLASSKGLIPAMQALAASEIQMITEMANGEIKPDTFAKIIALNTQLKMGFNTDSYLNANPDVAAYSNGLSILGTMHYALHGNRERRTVDGRNVPPLVDLGLSSTRGLDADGNSSTQLSRNGVLERVVRTDTGTTDAWSSVTTNYAQGGATIASQRVLNDDGVIYDYGYSNGTLTSSVGMDVEDKHNWKSVSAQVDEAGRATSQTGVFDDGKTWVNTYSAPGVFQRQVVSDAAGKVVSAFGVDADGNRYVETYTNGVLDKKTITDTGVAESWQTRTVSYGLDGRTIIGMTSINDDRTVYDHGYTAGAMAWITATDPDNTQDWTNWVAEVDASGRNLSQTGVADNGNRWSVRYSSPGVLEEQVMVNSDNKMVGRIAVDADGNTFNEKFENGIRKSSTYTDTGASDLWETFTYDYSANGQTVVAKYGRNDNGETFAYRYVEGVAVPLNIEVPAITTPETTPIGQATSAITPNVPTAPLEAPVVIPDAPKAPPPIVVQEPTTPISVQLAAQAGYTHLGDRVTSAGIGTNQYIQSANEKFFAVFQADGNFVVYRGTPTSNQGAIWASGTNKKANGGSVQMQSDGNLVVYRPDGKARWSSATHTSGVNRPMTLVMQNDGNLVVYDSRGGAALWSSVGGRNGRPGL